MGCLKLNIENPTLLRVLNGGKSANPKSRERSYWFGYNGMEKDPEMKGEGNSYTTEFRQYDPRLGRWLSLDPLMQMFPSISPYVAFDNNPIMFNDPTGLKSEGWGGRTDANGKTNYTFAENITADNYKTINGGYDSYMEGSAEGMIRENGTIDNGPKGTVLVFNDGKAIYFTPGLEAECIGKKKPKTEQPDATTYEDYNGVTRYKDWTDGFKNHESTSVPYADGESMWTEHPENWTRYQRTLYGGTDMMKNVFAGAFIFIATGGMGLEAMAYSKGVQILIGSSANLMGQYTTNGANIDKVDVASVAMGGLTSFIPTFGINSTVPKLMLQSSASGGLDAMVDINYESGPKFGFFNKEFGLVANDFVWGTLGNIASGAKAPNGVPSFLSNGMPNFLSTGINTGLNDLWFPTPTK